MSDDESPPAAPASADAPRPELAELRARLGLTTDEGRPDAVERRRKTGQRTARENIADLTDAGSFVEVQGTAEGRAFSREELDSLLGLAQSGIARLLEVQQLTLGEQGFPVTARV